MHHPCVIESIWEVISSVGSSRFLSVLGGEHGHLCLDHQVLKLHCLDQVSVPDLATVRNTDIGDALGIFVQCIASLFEVILTSEHGSVFLHGRLHLRSDHGCGGTTSGITEFIKSSDAFLSSVSRELALGFTWSVIFIDSLSSTAAKDDQVKE